jgi:hypothetical protein
MEEIEKVVLVDKKCSHCSNIFKATMWTKQKFCSRNCQYIYSQKKSPECALLRQQNKKRAVSELIDKKRV